MKKKSKQALEALQLSLPTKWADLTGEQVVRVAYHLTRHEDKDKVMVELALEFAMLKPNGSGVTDKGDIVPMFYHRGMRKNIALTVESVAAIVDAMSWVISEPEHMASPIIPGYSTPDNELNDFDVERFVYVDSAFALYAGTGDDSFRRMFVAALYPRKGFDIDTVDAQARKIAYLPAHYFEAASLWYIGVKKFLQAKYPHVLKPGDGTGGQPLVGEDLLRQLTSSLNNGDITLNGVIKRSNFHDAMFELEQKLIAIENASKHK